MEIRAKNEAVQLHLYHLSSLFFHERKDDFCILLKEEDEKIIITLEKGEKTSLGEESVNLPLHKENQRAKKAALGKAFFKATRAFTNYIPPYGLLFGVRPVKVPIFYRKNGYSIDETRRILKEEFLVSSEKADLLMGLCQKELDFEKSIGSRDAMLYLSIPFCPSRCTYCSFISSSAPKHLSLIPEYLEKMREEMISTASLLQEKGRKISAVYMGGGTPGILTPEQMELILKTVREEFDLSSLREFTVEMGRPDTITQEKLSVLVQNGVDRISINPQTTKNETLERIGRRHSAKDFYSAMALAKEFPTLSVNCDLIAGLPGEEPEDFLSSLEKVLSFEPAEVTLHALCRKRSAEKKEELSFTSAWQDAMKTAHKICINEGLSPYYLYRQKNAVSDLENTGFAGKGKIGVYNLAMMEDLCDIFAVGAGGIGKLLPKKEGDKIRRFPGFKYPFEYLSYPEKIQEKLNEIKGLL